MVIRIAAVAVITAGCRLGPLVEDLPGASANLLPPGSAVPSVLDNRDLVGQIALNDGLGDPGPGDAIVVPRGTGTSAGVEVRYWSFGPATSAPSPLYEFFRATDAGPARIDHPGLVDALPGDRGYSPFHTLFRVVVTPAYAGELITTPAALADAIELGLVDEPVSTGSLVASPLVLPTTVLEVGAGVSAVPVVVYARGYTVGMFRLGGGLSVQAGSGLVLASDVSFMRERGAASFDLNRPIFQATIPTSAPARYTPLSAAINVDLTEDVEATDIKQDSDLFTRSPSGEITGMSPKVSHYEFAGQNLLLQLQFADGQL